MKMMDTIWEILSLLLKMIAGEPYCPSDSELVQLSKESRQKQNAFNNEENLKEGLKSSKNGLAQQEKMYTLTDGSSLIMALTFISEKTFIQITI